MNVLGNYCKGVAYTIILPNSVASEIFLFMLQFAEMHECRKWFRSVLTGNNFSACIQVFIILKGKCDLQGR